MCVQGLLLLCVCLGEPGGPAGDPEPRITRHTHDGLEKIRPAWSPDGSRLLYARHEPDHLHIRLYLVDPGNSDDSPRRLTDRQIPEYSGVFSPDGRDVLFVVVRQNGTQGNLDIARIAADGSGEVATIAGDVDNRLWHQDWPSWSPDGSRFAFSSTHEGNQEIYTAKSDGTDLVRLSRHPGIDAHPCWTPDGARVVFATDRWGGLEIASVSAEGGDTIRLTTSPGLDDYPAVSPDGTRVAYTTHRDGQFEVYLMDLDGSNPVNLTDHPARDTQPTWTPDGHAVTFVSDRDGGADVYTIAVAP